jgi:hypothetical protein
MAELVAVCRLNYVSTIKKVSHWNSLSFRPSEGGKSDTFRLDDSAVEIHNHPERMFSGEAFL